MCKSIQLNLHNSRRCVQTDDSCSETGQRQSTPHEVDIKH